MVTWSHALSNCTAVAACQCAENAQSGHGFGARIRAEMFAACRYAVRGHCNDRQVLNKCRGLVGGGVFLN